MPKSLNFESGATLPYTGRFKIPMSHEVVSRGPYYSLILYLINKKYHLLNFSVSGTILLIVYMIIS